MRNYKNLAKIYNQISEEYFQTRQKYRKEGELILQYIKKEIPHKKKIKILDLGCGGGRVRYFIKKNIPQESLNKISYTGVDFSSKLINLAKKNYPNAKFIKADILSYLKKQKAEQFDFVIFSNSFQHIKTENDRKKILELTYQILKYDGFLVQINRSFSKRFIKKYFFEILYSIFLSIITLGNYKRNDIYIPRKSKKQNKTFRRFYHIFTIGEIEKLCLSAGFIIVKKSYSSNKSLNEKNRKNSKNTIIICQKKVFL